MVDDADGGVVCMGDVGCDVVWLGETIGDGSMLSEPLD